MFEGSDQPTHGERWQKYSHWLPQLRTEENSVEMISNQNFNEKDYLLLKSPIKPSPYIHFATPSKKKRLSLIALIVLIFYEVSGGPFGIEDVVRAGGPFYAIVGFSLLLVWAIPEALITAELGTAMPEASGAVAWVDCAFGPFWAFQKGWYSWLSGVTDNALYPILFLDSLVSLFSEPDNPSILAADGGNQSIRWLFIMTTTFLLTYLNYRGLDIVGTVAIIICLLSLLPFATFCVLGATKVDPSRWLIAPKGGFYGVDWRLLLNTFFWNINFWESAAIFSGEVENPAKTFPKGLAYAIVLVFISLILPIMIGTGASDKPYSSWTDGYFVQLAKEIVGPWLGYWMMFASAISNIGMFEAEMSSDSWQVAGMADRGILPSVLSTRNQYETPTYAILLSTIGIISLCWMSFSDVVDMLNLLFCFGQIIEFFAFLQLRISKPDMPRSYKVNLGFYGMCVVLAFPIIFIIIILCISSSTSLIVCFSLSILGVVVYYLLEYAKKNNWCEFYDRTLDEISS